MVGIYVTLIQHKMWTFDKVAPEFQEEVKNKLENLGLDTNGNIISK